jgi:3-oxoacyl-[acyl-carrier-protein] synthase III
MLERYRAQCVAVGTAVPNKRLTNADLETMVDTSDEWIVSRTGIRERRIAETGTPLSELAIPAAQQCLERAGVPADLIDGIIVATITPDYVMPTTANLVQHRIGASRAFAFDMANACNGFVAAISTAACFIEAGRAKRILVLGGDIMSSITDYTDRNTCILFGDGCGAVLLEAGPADGPGLIGFELHSDGEHGELLCVPASGSAMSRQQTPPDSDAVFLKQDGHRVFSHAVRRMTEVTDSLLQTLELQRDDIDLLVPHQANRRIIEPLAQRLALPLTRVVINIDTVANTTDGTIPLALDEAYRDGRLQDGSRVMLVAFGGGLSWGAAYLRWGRSVL